MRIIGLKEFLALEGEVLFSKYVPQYFQAPEIKLCNAGDRDFCTQRVADSIKANSSDQEMDLLFRAQETGESFELDFDCGGRDGMYNDNQLFAIWEPQDVRQLLARLQQIVGPNGAEEAASENWAYIQKLENYLNENDLLTITHEGGAEAAAQNVIDSIERLRSPNALIQNAVRALGALRADTDEPDAFVDAEFWNQAVERCIFELNKMRVLPVNRE
jgi:hypothetical protein